VNNSFPAYTPFTRAKSSRYVFEQYESTRGATLFQPKDRLYLTRSIMLRFMDLDILDDYDAIKVRWWWYEVACGCKGRGEMAASVSDPFFSSVLSLASRTSSLPFLTASVCVLILLGAC